MKPTIVLILLTSVLLTSSYAQNTNGDENWDARFYTPGGYIEKIIPSPESEFYVSNGYYWSYVDSIPSKEFPKWTGSAWVSGLPRVLGGNIITIDSSGIYAKGTFLSLSGDTIRGFAKWDRHEW